MGIGNSFDYVDDRVKAEGKRQFARIINYRYEHTPFQETIKATKKERQSAFKNLLIIVGLLMILMRSTPISLRTITHRPQTKFKRCINGYFEKRANAWRTGKFLLWSPH